LRPILIAGAWGGGTSAVAGCIDQLGADGLPPYWAVDDPRTGSTFESAAFRSLLLDIVDEAGLELKVAPAMVVPALVRFRKWTEAQAGGQPYFLKHPLAALVLEELGRVFAPRFLFVFRSPSDIEATRRRRRWAPRFGAEPARILYARMIGFKARWQSPVLTVHYEDLCADPVREVDRIADFIQLGDPKQRMAAALTVRRRPS
jgi:hypothetical protein